MRTVWNLDDAKATLLIRQGCTSTEVAERLGVSRQAVNHAIRKGRIPRPGELDASTEANGTQSSTPRAGA